MRDVGRQLGVRYVLEGSVRRSGDRLRVTAQLVDATDGSHVWAERYDRRVQDIFDIQDELTKEIVTALRIKLTDGEQANIWLRSTDNVEAWGYAMRGADHMWRGTAADMAQARVLFESAVACDPAYAKAAAMVAQTHYFDIRFNYTRSFEESERKATEWTSKALELDPDDQYALMLKSALLTIRGEFSAAVEGMKRLIARSPNDVFLLAFFGALSNKRRTAARGGAGDAPCHAAEPVLSGERFSRARRRAGASRPQPRGTGRIGRTCAATTQLHFCAPGPSGA